MSSDLVGQTFGRLTVIKKAEGEERPKTKHRGAYWVCQCSCGNFKTIRTDGLTSGGTCSCGCLQREAAAKSGADSAIDITGQRFGKLTVIERAGTIERGAQKKKLATWRCLCDCGREYIAVGAALRSGNTKSCGCLRSQGETKIRQLLTDNNIPFETEYAVKIGNSYKRFDFFVNNSYFIEFDGEQHFHIAKGVFGEDDPEQALLDTQARDAEKTQYCIDANIPLIRIPYTKLENLKIEDLLLD